MHKKKNKQTKTLYITGYVLLDGLSGVYSKTILSYVYADFLSSLISTHVQDGTNEYFIRQ